MICCYIPLSQHPTFIVGPRAPGAVPGAAVRRRGGPGGLLQDGLPPPQVPRRDVLLQGRRRRQ